VADHPQNIQGVVAATPEAHSPPPNHSGGGRTTPETPRESTKRCSGGGATALGAICGWPTTHWGGQPTTVKEGGVSIFSFFFF
jgi:hypothetical protein